MQKKDIIKRVNLALDLFYEKDRYLLSINVNERSIAHKFSEYLQLLFADYNVDCEYDRHGQYVKELEGISECSTERQTDRILPDIIIHKRGHDKDNLIVFEIKCKAEATPCDLKKLELLTRRKGRFRYKFGIFVRFYNERSDCQLRFFKNGTENGN